MKNMTLNIHEPYPGWLDEAVDTHEAARITGIPVPSLITIRSRSNAGPVFFRPQNARNVRYFRRSLYEWMLSGSGLLNNTSGNSHLVENIGADDDNDEGK